MNDDFYVLIRKKPEDTKIDPVIPKENVIEIEPDKESHKKKLPKYKKSSWKHALLKRMKKWREDSNVEDFHFTKLENIIICFGKKKSTVTTSYSRFGIHMLKSIYKKHRDDAYILINATDQMYMKMDIMSYLKLMTIVKIGIDFTLEGSYDGLEKVDILHSDIIIDNINELCRFINYHRQAIEGVHQLQCECCGFMEYDYRFRMMVWKTDNTVEVYKGDMNDFMTKYGLFPF